jgi:hypothetical protein
MITYLSQAHSRLLAGLAKAKPAERVPFSGAVIFDTPEQFFEVLFGPDQHDAHVKRWRRHRTEKIQSEWLAERHRIEMQPNFSGQRFAT